ncbi:carboxyl transferase domain-containing protein [Bacillus sp. SL00103]
MSKEGPSDIIKNKEKGKLFVRDRLQLLLDQDSFIEDAMFAECKDEHLPADGVVTGTGRMNGQTVCVMANDSTVKADRGASKRSKKSSESKKQQKNSTARCCIS